MSPFEVIPAIDIRFGKVVRLELGDPNRQTIFESHPPAVGRRWVEQGAEWIHVVNLDGALEDGAFDWGHLSELATCGARLQLGGGIRGRGDIVTALDRGADRVILGTVAVEEPERAERLLSEFGGGKINVALDVSAGRIKSRGWQKSTTTTPLQLAQRLQGEGLKRVILTDIRRDGVYSGANIEEAVDLMKATDLEIIVSGGVATLDDIRRAHEAGLAGIIIGRALYEERFRLDEALALVESDSSLSNAGQG